MKKVKDKTRLLHLVDYLYQNTDEHHVKNTYEILDYLGELGYTADRKTLQDDVDTLQELDLPVFKKKSSPNKYWWGNKLFSSDEIQMMTDAILSARFLSKEKSKELTMRLAKFAAGVDRDQLMNEIESVGRVKSGVKESYGNISMIHKAITQKRKIAFKYMTYNADKKFVPREENNPHHVSPYKLYWNDDRYYMIGYDDEHKGIRVFRVEYMDGIRFMRSPYREKTSNERLNRYSDMYFSMFDGPEVEIELEVKNDLMRYIIEKFGKKVYTEKKTDETFTVKAPIKLSPTFYGWVFQFGGDVKIIGPERAVEEFNEMKDKA